MANLKPLQDRVVIERLEAEEKTASGIILAAGAAEKPDIGIIVAIGDGKTTPEGKNIPMTLKVGDKVIFGKYSGQEVKLDGKTLIIMREEDIFGIVK